MEAKKGHGCQFVTEPPNKLKCVICQAVARQPQQHGVCGKLFCLSCLTQHSQLSANCPSCDQQLITFYDGRSEQEIKQLKVRCDNLKNGCQWTGELRSLHTHVRNCDYTTVSCPNHCERMRSYKLLQRDLATHLEVCPARTHQCPHCNIMGPYQELTTSHLETCPKVEVTCPNPTCNLTIQRCYLGVHKVTCQNVLHPCKYASVGCPAQLRLVDVQAHEEDDQLHLQITKEKVLELVGILESRERRFREHIEKTNREIATLKERLPVLRQTNSPAVFRFKGFDSHKLQDKQFTSPAFYVEAGYRFHLVIYANGHGRYTNTHVSLFAYLVQGYKDESLPWPYRGALKIEVLNQEDDKNHVCSIIRYTDVSPGDRPMSNRRFITGWGREDYFSNRQLFNVSRKRRYLKNDALYFRVSCLSDLA